MASREELQAVMDRPGFGTGRVYLDRARQEADALAMLPDRNSMAPVMASTDPCENWLICSFGNSNEDGKDWHLVTDQVRGSAMGDFEFPEDAKMDAIRTAAVLNAYRMGLLVVKPAP